MLQPLLAAKRINAVITGKMHSNWNASKLVGMMEHVHLCHVCHGHGIQQLKQCQHRVNFDNHCDQQVHN